MKPDRSLLPTQLIAAALSAVMLGGCASLRDADEAIIRVEASQNPEKAARLTLAGVKALEHGYMDRASTKFAEAIAADQTYGPAHNNLGLLYYDQGDLYQAVLSFEQAMEFMPNDPAVYYNLGMTLESAGRTFEAMDLYLQAVEMDPSNPNYLGNLCRLRVRMGENDPILVTQLQDLALIETRPDWRRWADDQLALYFNPVLDRGPSTPEFNTGSGANRAQRDAATEDNVIDLTLPPPGGGNPPSSRPQAEDINPKSEMQLQPSVEQIPLPAGDGPFDTLPPGDTVQPSESSKRLDYFRD